ncbi:hypothetical protein [Agromyces sp. Root81]|uniref:hypothetical protein n=1 Tax=Agromyces sp. Root81 TaxID=1736601 RepID=UPI000ACE80A5|nr:hypothetical protein [Agromyces sp. Root81]
MTARSDMHVDGPRGVEVVGLLVALFAASAAAMGLAIALGCLLLAPSAGVLGGVASRLLT